MKIKNKKLAAAAVLLVVVLTFGLVNALPSIIKNWYLQIDNYRDICVHEAYAIITYQPYRNVVILDVRSEGEFNGTKSAGHIAGAIHIEWTELEANLSDPVHCPLVGHENDTIIVYCKTGGRSANASAILADHDFQMVYNMVGGIDAWTYSVWYYPLVVEAPPSYTNIDVHEAYEMMTNGSFPDLVIVDVRTPGQYAAEHIENAINIPYYNDADFGTRIGPLAGHENDEIIVYCQSEACPKSPSASQYLVDHGFTKVYNMLGGIDAWKADGHPVWTPSEDLIPNRSVEEDSDGNGIPDFWQKDKASGVGSCVWCLTAHTGERSLEVTIQPNPTEYQWKVNQWRQFYFLDSASCPYERGGTYKLRAWYQTENATMWIYAGMWDASGWIQSAFKYVAVRSATPSTWEQSDWITFTVPVNAEYIAVGMAIRLGEIDAGVSEALGRADDFEVQEVT